MTAIHQLAEKAADGTLQQDDMSAGASGLGISTAACYDAIALYLASGYVEDKLEFEFCDSAMNYIMGFASYEVPDFTWAVFSAFDEGEYFHSNDSRNEDPAEKYTRPQLEQILKTGVEPTGSAA